MWPYPWTHVGTPSHLGHMDQVAATMPSQAHAGAAQEAPDIGQWEGQDVPLVRPSSCNVKGGIPSSRRYLPTYLGFVVRVSGLGLWLSPRQCWLDCWVVCVLVCALRLYPANRGWVVRSGRVCLGSGFGSVPPFLAGGLGCVCFGMRAPPVPRRPRLGCAVWVYVLWLGIRLRPAIPGWVVGVCVSVCALRPYPAISCWGLWCVGWVLPGTCSSAVVRCLLCSLFGFAARGSRCYLTPVRVPWLWPAACPSGVARLLGGCAGHVVKRYAVPHPYPLPSQWRSVHQDFSWADSQPMTSRFLWNSCKIPQKSSFFGNFGLALTFVACVSQPQIEVFFLDF